MSMGDEYALQRILIIFNVFKYGLIHIARINDDCLFLGRFSGSQDIAIAESKGAEMNIELQFSSSISYMASAVLEDLNVSSS